MYSVTSCHMLQSLMAYHITYFKLTKCHMPIISQWSWKGKRLMVHPHIWNSSAANWVVCGLQLQQRCLWVGLEWQRGEHSWWRKCYSHTSKNNAKFIPCSLIMLMYALTRVRFHCMWLKETQKTLCACLFNSHLRIWNRSHLTRVLSNLLLYLPSLRLLPHDSWSCLSSSHHVHVPANKKKTHSSQSKKGHTRNFTHISIYFPLFRVQSPGHH